MSFVTSMFDKDRGVGFNAQKADILNPFNTAQTTQAAQQAQGGLHQQQNLYGQMAAQNGLGNQSSVFNQQQGLANLMGMQALGYGPNPAMDQLNQTTGQNIANQSAMMAGQRGSNANAGLMARQAAQQGAGTQQQAVGQAAVMRAQQQLAAQQALSGQQANMANLSGAQVSQQANTLQNYNAGTQAQQQNLLNALGNYNAANVTMQGNMNNANAGIANTNAQGQQAMFGGALKGVSNMFSMGMAKGGMVQHFDDGGEVDPVFPKPQEFTASSQPAQSSPPHFEFDKPLSFAANYMNGNSVAANTGVSAAPTAQQQSVASPQAGSPSFSSGNPGADALNSGFASIGEGIFGLAGKGMKAASSMMGSSGGGEGGDSGGGGSSMMKMLPMLAMAANKGAYVPGKADVQGDSLKNDHVPAMLSPGEIVIPRHVVQSDDPSGNAAKFVAAVLAKQKGKK